MKNENLSKTVSARVKQLIDEHNAAHPDSKYTHKYIAEKVLFIHEAAFSAKINNNGRGFSFEEVQKLADFFSVSDEWIYGRTKYRSHFELWTALKAEADYKFGAYCNALQALCMLKGVELITPQLSQNSDGEQKADENNSDKKRGFIFKTSDRQVKMTLQEFLAYGNKLLDHFAIELRNLFDEKSESIEGE